MTIPWGIVIDSAGNLYVTTYFEVKKINSVGVDSTFAGGTQGNADGTGTAAQFNYASGIAIDSTGNLYVADYSNHRIRKITPSGVVSTFAGSSQGYADGNGTAAQFNSPYGIAIDSSGNLYVADYYGRRIRKISTAGVVSTFAGANGYVDGAGTIARFSSPSGITQDYLGNLYVADRRNHKIRKITPDGVVSSFAGSSQGYADGTGTAAQFNSPYGIAIDSAGNLYGKYQ